MKDENCIFCKIVSGEIPSTTIYEDENFKAILDVMPASKGHALIIPKAHYVDLYELEDGLAAEVLVLAKKIIGKMREVVDCDGYNLVQNNGKAAGQTVFHFHMHLIPRYEGDRALANWKAGKLEDKDKEQILKQFDLKC